MSDERLDYTVRRIDVSEGRGYSPHMHLGHFISFFQENTASLWRHAAHAHGKEVQTPFPGREAIDVALGLDPSKRYVRRLKSKWLLKHLLKQRMPEYEIDKPKQSSGVNIERYFTTGPLADAFEEYPVPEIIPDEASELIRNGSDHASWYAFSYAVWAERILQNDDLDYFDTTSVYEYY